MCDHMGVFRGKKFCMVFMVVCMLFSLAGTLYAHESGVFGAGGGSKKEGPFEFEFEGGLKVVFESLTQSSSDNRVLVLTLVAKSEEDMSIKLNREGCVAFDNAGNQLALAYDALWIGNHSSGSYKFLERMIIEGVPTKIAFRFDKGNYEITELYPRIDINVMGKVLTMRSVPAKK